MRKLLVLCLVLPLAGCYEVSTGEMAGNITYFTKRGYFCKTWEGQIIMRGLRREYQTNLSSDGKSTTTSSSMVANTATFTVEMTVGQVRQFRAAYNELNRIINSPEYIPANLSE